MASLRDRVVEGKKIKIKNGKKKNSQERLGKEGRNWGGIGKMGAPPEKVSWPPVLLIFYLTFY